MALALLSPFGQNSAPPSTPRCSRVGPPHPAILHLLGVPMPADQPRQLRPENPVILAKYAFTVPFPGFPSSEAVVAKLHQRMPHEPIRRCPPLP